MTDFFELAGIAGNALIQAMTTDAWESGKEEIDQLFVRGNPRKGSRAAA
jgi:hypothetical protein